MDDRERVRELIERVVRDAHFSNDRERDELRCELESHFAEAAQSRPISAAVEQFGSPHIIGEEIGRVHRRNRLVMHAARIATAAIISVAIALAIQVVANVRLDFRTTILGVAPSFPRSAWFSVMLAIALVAAWELDIQSLCAPIERDPLRLTLTLFGLATSMLLFHAFRMSPLLPSKAFVESGLDTIIWASTIAILTRLDRTFAGTFRTLE